MLDFHLSGKSMHVYIVTIDSREFGKFVTKTNMNGASAIYVTQYLRCNVCTQLYIFNINGASRVIESFSINVIP